MTVEILEYYVFTTRDGGLWLHGDRRHWTPEFRTASAFSNPETAEAVGNEQHGFDDAIYIFALLGSQ